MSTSIDRSIELRELRCYRCGRFYHFEVEGPEVASCPLCSTRRIRELSAANEVLERRISALRGALTKAKRRRK